ncbi:hypothetical protein REPUB_Repub17cG0185200 [Reevesia pubescens]
MSAGLNFLIALFFLPVCNSRKALSCSSSCGNVSIKNPFRLRNDPEHCGYFFYELACEHDRTVLKIDFGSFYVESISYNYKTLHVVDPGLNKNDCSSLPRYAWTSNNLSYQGGHPYYDRPYSLSLETDDTMIFLNCSTPMDPSKYLDASPCITNSSLPQAKQPYIFFGTLQVSSLRNSCDFLLMTPAVFQTIGNHTYSDIHKKLTLGYELSWSPYMDLICRYNGRYCSYSYDPDLDADTECRFQVPSTGPSANIHCFAEYLWSNIQGCIGRVSKPVGLYIIVRSAIGIMCMSLYLIYKWRERASMDQHMEEFLLNYENLKPGRFSYSDIKKMTEGFKEKLGEGGFGSVFKGNLSNGRLVAVKMLGEAKGNGEDFINEVATIGMIHHVNVVQLLGFCFERSKRALIYEYMPNGSLDKYLFSQGNVCPLSWIRMYEIALAIAHGIEYLHRGCHMRILHFDIKPHNILLDEDYTPKVSDFGLAKLYPRNDSIVSLTNARGTIGYMAPELLYKNIGGISYKSDVYSFGMLLMEMAGRRKNLNPFVENLSQIYFPTWIYDQLEQKGEVEIKDVTSEEKDIGKRMIMIALWCIQLKPTDRPSMTKVVEMLEDTSEPLPMPPKPVLAPDRKRS